jgi:hypothetical protein
MDQANPQSITANAVDTAPELARARRLALKCKSVAASGRSWAVILAGRLQSSKPMTPQAVEVAIGMARSIASDADLLHATAMTLLATLRAGRAGSNWSDTFPDLG